MKRTWKQVLGDAAERFWNDIKNAKWAMLVIVAYFVFMRTVFHSACPVVITVGYPCPACGLTRAGWALLHLDFPGAFRMHLFIYPIAAFVATYCVERYILLKQKASPWMMRALIVLLIGMILYYIWRMYRYFPGEPPMSYNSHALIVLLRNL